MKKGSTLSYSHGFNIVEEGMQIRKDITVMCVQNVLDPKYVRIKRFWSTYFNCCTSENDPNGDGFEQAKAHAVATGGHKAGVQKLVRCRGKIRFNGRTNYSLRNVANGSILCFDKMVEGIEPAYASKLIQ
jgi:ketol-acid reductoisomerase